MYTSKGKIRTMKSDNKYDTKKLDGSRRVQKRDYS